MRIIYRNNVDHLMFDLRMGNTAEIFDIIVMSERGKGIGTDMLNEMINIIRKIGVKRVYAFTRAENKLAQSFYQKNGFSKVKVPKFYEDGDAYLYSKEI